MKQDEALSRLRCLLGEFDRGALERSGQCRQDGTQYADDCGYIVSHLEMLSIAQLLLRVEELEALIQKTSRDIRQAVSDIKQEAGI